MAKKKNKFGKFGNPQKRIAMQKAASKRKSNNANETRNYAIRIVIPDGQGAADFVDFVAPMKPKWLKKPENIIIDHFFDSWCKIKEDAGDLEPHAKTFLNNLRTLRRQPFHRIASRIPDYGRQIVVELADGQMPYELAKFACGVSHAQVQHPQLNSWKEQKIKALKNLGLNW